MDVAPEFLAKEPWPSLNTLAFGFRRGWMRPRDVVGVELARLKAQKPMSPLGETVALLLPDQYPELEDILSTLPEGSAEVRYWLYALLSSVDLQWDEYIDAWSAVTELYEIFDHPPEMRAFVPYTSVWLPGAPAPDRADRQMRDGLRAFLSTTRASLQAQST